MFILLDVIVIGGDKLYIIYIFVAGKQNTRVHISYWFYWWPADKPPLLVNHHTNQTLVYAGVQLCCSVLLAVRAHTVVISPGQGELERTKESHDV